MTTGVDEGCGEMSGWEPLQQLTKCIFQYLVIYPPTLSAIRKFGLRQYFFKNGQMINE